MACGDPWSTATPQHAKPACHHQHGRRRLRGGLPSSHACSPPTRTATARPTAATTPRRSASQRYSNTAPVLTDVSSAARKTAASSLRRVFISGFNDRKVVKPRGDQDHPAGPRAPSGSTASTPSSRPGDQPAELQAGKLTYQGNTNLLRPRDQFAWTGNDGVAFAGTPVPIPNINLTNVNDALAPRGRRRRHRRRRPLSPTRSPATLTRTSPDHRELGATAARQHLQHQRRPVQHRPHLRRRRRCLNVTVTANDQQGKGNSAGRTASRSR